MLKNLLLPNNTNNNQKDFSLGYKANRCKLALSYHVKGREEILSLFLLFRLEKTGEDLFCFKMVCEISLGMLCLGIIVL